MFLPSHLYTGSGPKSTGSDRLRQTAYEYNIKKGHTYRDGGAAGRVRRCPVNPNTRRQQRQPVTMSSKDSAYKWRNTFNICL